jgi:hypothetical protein
VILEMSMLLQRFLLASCGEQARGPKTVVGISFRGPFVRNEVRPANRMGFRPGVPAVHAGGYKRFFFEALKCPARSIRSDTGRDELCEGIWPRPPARQGLQSP